MGRGWQGRLSRGLRNTPLSEDVHEWGYQERAPTHKHTRVRTHTHTHTSLGFLHCQELEATLNPGEPLAPWLSGFHFLEVFLIPRTTYPSHGQGSAGFRQAFVSIPPNGLL